MATISHDRFTLGALLDRVDTGDFIVSSSTYSAGQFLSAHAHELACATIVLRGDVSERVGSRRFECGNDQFLVRPAGVVHENRYGPRGADCMIVGVREHWSSHDRIGRDVFSVPRTGASAADIARRMRRELRMGDRAAALTIEGLALEFIAAASRQLDSSGQRAAPRWLRTVRDQLHDGFARDVRLSDIARDAGVHAVSLARAFRECFGCTPGEYVRQRRIDQASLELATTARSIAEIAVDAGFASPSHFATAFRKATGMAPSTYRSRARAE